MKRTQKGFTLVELLVVIAILAILATVSVVGYTSFIDRANESNAKTEANQIKTSIESALVIPDEVYQVANGCYAKKNGSKVIVLYSDETCTTEINTNTEFDLNADGAMGDFVGLKGKLKVESGKLVYISDGYSTAVDVVVIGNTASGS